MISLLNTELNTIHIPRKTFIGKLQPMEIENFEISNIWCTTCGTSNAPSSLMKSPSMPPESSFQPEGNNARHAIVLQDAQIPQEAKGGLSLLLDRGLQ